MTTIDTVSDADFHRILTGNALHIFSERDAAKRREALHRLWQSNGILYERDHAVSGIDAISESVGRLLDLLPPGTSFQPVAPAMGHNGLGVLRWRAIDAAGQPLPVTGTDVATIVHDRIASLHVLLDPMPADAGQAGGDL